MLRPPAATSTGVSVAGPASGVHWDFLSAGRIQLSSREATRCARSSKPFRTRRISIKDAESKAGRATRIKSQPGCNSSKRGRIASRNKRLALFLFTAPPTDRPAVTPTRNFCDSLTWTNNTTNGWANDFPERRTRLKSVDRVRRYLRCTRTSECQLYAYSNQSRTEGDNRPNTRPAAYHRTRFTCSLAVTVNL